MNTMNNLQNVNVDSQLYDLMNNSKTLTPNIGSVYVNMPMPVSSSSQNTPYSLQSPTKKIENNNQINPVNPLLNLLNSPHTYNQPETDNSYSPENATNTKNNGSNNDEWKLINK